MKKIHDHLTETAPWYRAWHNHSGHGLAHWSALVVVGITLTSSLLTGVSNYYTDQLAAAAINDLERVQSIHTINNQFIAAVKSYSKLPVAGREQARANLIKLAKDRKTLVENIISKDARGVSKNLFSEDFIANIPDELDEYFEQSVEKNGKVELLYIDNDNPALSRIETQFVEDDDSSTRYTLVWNSDSADIKPNSRVKVKGKQIGSTIVLEDNGSGSVQVTSSAPANNDPITKRLLAIMVNFTDNTSQPFTKESLYARLFTDANSITNFYNETSYNKIAVSGDVTPWLTINDSQAPCEWPNWMNLAKTAASQAGYNLSSYNYFMLFMSPNSNCGFAGSAYIGGSTSAVNGYGNEGTPTHELGHNFGEYHAGQITCGSKQIDIATNCSVQAYYDPSDVMGFGGTYRNFNGFHRINRGWVTSSEVSTVSQNGTYTINWLGSTGSGVKVLKIAKPDTAENYYISYKQPVGFDAQLPTGITKGVSIHSQGKNETGGNNLGYITKLLHLYPGTGASNASLADGGLFNDTVNNIKVMQLNHSETSAQVSVEFGAVPCTRANPSVTVSPASQTAKAGVALVYNVTVRNNDTTSCPTSTFSLSYGIPSNWLGNYSVSSVSLPPGGTGASSLTITSGTAQADGSYQFSASAANVSDSTKSASGQATYVVYTPSVDTIAPSVMITDPSSGTKVSGNTTIKASASDNIRVTKVEFYVDGKLISTDTSTPYSARWNANKQVSAGTHSISARAYDAAGNMSESSAISVVK